MSVFNYWGSLTNRPGLPFSRLLTDDGTPTGDCAMVGDYSSAVTDFWTGPPDNVNYVIGSMALYISLANAPDKEHYGQIANGLVNGVEFIYQRGAEERSLNQHGPIKTNTDIIRANGRPYNTDLNGNSILYIFDFDFLKFYGRPLTIFGHAGDKVIARVNDDLEDQDVHCIAINGVRQAVTRAQQL